MSKEITSEWTITGCLRLVHKGGYKSVKLHIDFAGHYDKLRCDLYKHNLLELSIACKEAAKYLESTENDN